MMIEKLTSGVITVGHGRGFVVEGAGGRLVITAAHCLPFLSPALSSLGLDARVFGPLLAPRGEAPRACATCRFVDPIANIAVLGSPDALQADDYKELVSTATALPIGDRDRHPVNFWPGPATIERRPVVLLHHSSRRWATVDCKNGYPKNSSTYDESSPCRSGDPGRTTGTSSPNAGAESGSR